MSFFLRCLSTLQSGIDVVLCDNVILKMIADNYCCIMPDHVEDAQWLLLYDGWQLLLQNYCYTIIVQQSLTTIVAQWCWRFLMPGRKCKVDLSSRERWILQLGTKQSIQVNTLDLMMMTMRMMMLMMMVMAEVEVDPSTWNQPIHPSQYTRSDDEDDDDDTTEGKWGKK